MVPALSSVTIAALQPSRERMPLGGCMTIRDIEVRAFQGDGVPESTDGVVFYPRLTRHTRGSVRLCPRN
jgi:hypothetical protein